MQQCKLPGTCTVTYFVGLCAIAQSDQLLLCAHFRSTVDQDLFPPGFRVVINPRTKKSMSLAVFHHPCFSWSVV